MKKVLGRDRVEDIIQFEKGDVLFRDGDDADRLYLIQKGTLECSVHGSVESPDSGIRCDGDLVGTEALTDGATHHLTATCASTVRAVCLYRDELLKYPTGSRS